MSAITCNDAILTRTLAILQAAGERSEERVVLWLAPCAAIGKPIAVAEVYEPAQITAVDFFKLPTESLRALMAHLRGTRRKIVAQVHTHPGRAYHSEEDNAWAIVRHVGGLSLVLPTFARDTTPANFLDQAMTYELTHDGEWLEAPSGGRCGRTGAGA